ncbi:MAG: hypothetical protein WD688_03905 [Candidatus Binatia bacterium]
MKTKDLLKTWTGPDNSRLMRNQTSMRLSVHVAAKISALCEMFPQRTKTEIINDLLSTALDELALGLEDTCPWEENQEGVEYLTEKNTYSRLVEKYLREIEAGVGDENSQPGKSLASKGARKNA